MEVSATIANDLGDKVVDRQCAKFSIHTHVFRCTLHHPASGLDFVGSVAHTVETHVCKCQMMADGSEI